MVRRQRDGLAQGLEGLLETAFDDQNRGGLKEKLSACDEGGLVVGHPFEMAGKQLLRCGIGRRTGAVCGL